MSIGIRAYASLSIIEDADLVRAWAALASGSKSLVFQFAGLDESEQELVSLGAMVITPNRSPLSWGDTDRHVLLNFWDDASRMYVQDGAKFTVWYSRTIGTGLITTLVEDSELPL